MSVLCALFYFEIYHQIYEMYREQVPSAEINPKVGVAIKMNVACGCRGRVQSYECSVWV